MSLFIFFSILIIIVLIFLYNKRVKDRKEIYKPKLEEMTRYFSRLPNPDSPAAKEEMKKRMNETMEQIYGHKMTDEEFEEAFRAMKEWVAKNLKSR
jgi:hypothetical protein